MIQLPGKHSRSLADWLKPPIPELNYTGPVSQPFPEVLGHQDDPFGWAMERGGFSAPSGTRHFSISALNPMDYGKGAKTRQGRIQ